MLYIFAGATEAEVGGMGDYLTAVPSLDKADEIIRALRENPAFRWYNWAHVYSFSSMGAAIWERYYECTHKHYLFNKDGTYNSSDVILKCDRWIYFASLRGPALALEPAPEQSNHD